jgi:hypothetical protein
MSEKIRPGCTGYFFAHPKSHGLHLVKLMNPTQNTPQKPIKSPLHWHERLLHWSGWEHVIEYRWQLIGISLCLITMIWILAWWFARSESTSLSQTLRAEAIVQKLRNPESAPEPSEISVEKALQRLKELIPLGTPLATRFSGVIAEEEVMQHVHPISQERFSIASENLLQARLPTKSSLVLATQLSQDGKIDEALLIIDDIIAKSAVNFPQEHAYALLQKASLLREQKKANGAVIHELEQFLTSHPDIEASFDHVFSGKARDILAFLTID